MENQSTDQSVAAQCFHFNINNWTSSLLCKMQQDEVMCDTTICTSDGVTFHAHSCVLSSASPFFHTLLQTATPKLSYNLSINASASVVRLVLEFLYSGNIDVDISHLPSLHTVSLYLQIEELTKLVQEMIVQNSDSVTFEDPPLSQLVTLLVKQDNDVNIKREQCGLDSTDTVEDSAQSTRKSLDETFQQSLMPVKEEEEEESEDEDEDDDGEESDAVSLETDSVNHDSREPSSNKYSVALEVSHSNHGNPDNASEKCPTMVSCQDCGKRFLRERAILRHKRYCKGPQSKSLKKPFLCVHCVKSFNTETRLTRHISLVHSLVKQFHCKQCKVSFASQEQLSQHLLHKYHKGQMTLQCPNCPRQFGQQTSLDMHLSYCSKEDETCVICDKTFSNKAKLRNHMILHSDQRPHQCSVCNKTYKTKASLRVHSQLHMGSRPYCCFYCGQTFPQAGALYIHEKKHYAERTLACDICGKKFYFQSQLKHHSIVHESERSQICSECGKTFKTSSDLGVHQRIHKGEYPFTCQYCGKMFTTLGPCKAHERRHTGDKPYSCDFCPKRFAHSSTWRSHIMIHKGLKPYNCSHCGMTFRKRDHLNNHCRSKHEEKQSTWRPMGAAIQPSIHEEKEPTWRPTQTAIQPSTVFFG